MSEDNGDMFALSPQFGDVSESGLLDENSLDIKFREAREKWKDRVEFLTNEFRDVHKLAEVQSLSINDRQVLLEHKHYLWNVLAKVQKEYKHKKAKNWMVNPGVGKVTDRNVYVDAQLADIQEKISNVEAQIEYYHETIRTMDHIIYGVKQRIGLEDYKRE